MAAPAKGSYNPNSSVMFKSYSDNGTDKGKSPELHKVKFLKPADIPPKREFSDAGIHFKNKCYPGCTEYSEFFDKAGINEHGFYGLDEMCAISALLLNRPNLREGNKLNVFPNETAENSFELGTKETMNVAIHLRYFSEKFIGYLQKCKESGIILDENAIEALNTATIFMGMISSQLLMLSNLYDIKQLKEELRLYLDNCLEIVELADHKNLGGGKITESFCTELRDVGIDEYLSYGYGMSNDYDELKQEWNERTKMNADEQQNSGPRNALFADNQWKAHDANLAAQQFENDDEKFEAPVDEPHQGVLNQPGAMPEYADEGQPPVEEEEGVQQPGPVLE